ncbi:hypothetical protein Z517_09471 [Fonsecaea pedrosoi CBS 271.37]|uniref:NAD(P)-binding domain-containing protein n=1 Tax=Fonsecaea pedrosoi CBS 271.37 TaxID=1442368 RepID=A0A0D2GEK7_9EURO|nr:uncharacterized protein Z517_09471 [Fonsecaea pedrosoi CBS 271.37]KIW77025.1 hypothetical protein Z517_09471 [Fonsecaea pedrosoi CBS 271.37]
MHFLLVGATGEAGLNVVVELLLQGHTAVALVPPSAYTKLVFFHRRLTIVVGSPLSKSDIENALHAAPSLTPSAAIITLNVVRPFATRISLPRFLADSCANVCDVLQAAGISRVVVKSVAGVGDSFAQLPQEIKASMLLPSAKYLLEDYGLVDEEIRRTKMDWTLVRAVRVQYHDSMPPNQKLDVQTLGSNGEGMGLADCVSVVNLARFMVKVAAEGLFVREAVVVRD